MRITDILVTFDSYWFTIAGEDFKCCLENWASNDQYYWYPDQETPYIFDIDVMKGFRTPERCRDYMIKCIKKTIKRFNKEILQ